MVEEVTTVDLVGTVTVTVTVLVTVIVIVIVGHVLGLLRHRLVVDTIDMIVIVEVVETRTEIETVEVVVVEATTMIVEAVGTGTETEIGTEDGPAVAATVEETIPTTEEAVMVDPIQVQTQTSVRGRMTYWIGNVTETDHLLDEGCIHLTVAASAELSATTPLVVT